MRKAIWRLALLWTAAAAIIGCAAEDHVACAERGAHRSCVDVGRGHVRSVLPAAADDDDAGLDYAGSKADTDAGTDEDAGSAAPQPLPTHPILNGELVNARDLGGVPVGEADYVAYGALFRGPPLALSPAGCKHFAKLGVRTVIDLRIDDERAQAPDAACALDKAQFVAAPLPVPYDVSPMDYIADLDATDSMAEVFSVLGDDAAYPVYFHCTWGRDRTGIVAAVILRELGVSREDILHEYLLSRLTVGAFPVSLEAALDEIERRGGSTAYLTSLGISAHQIATLHAHAVPPAP